MDIYCDQVTLMTVDLSRFNINIPNRLSYKNKRKLRYIDITDKRLIELLNYSITKCQRTYLCENKFKGQIKEETLLRYLKNITLIKTIKVDMMRTIYITHFYENKNIHQEKNSLNN